jgi:hypothetical protein
MKELPIRFSGPMVKAILDGSKTQTRRVVKQDRDGLLDCKPTPAWDAFWQCVACPYGKPGDRLWVRETFGIDDEDGAVLYFADPDTAQNAEHARICEDRYPRRRPSIHMPRWASRILLEITDVRVERVQDISEADAQAEGIEYSERFEGYCIGMAEHYHSHDPRLSYASLWESINGPDSWAANPWVWVIEFRRIEP